jgi:hypothetical protein
MDHTIKKQLFDNFMNEWGTRFLKIPFILSYIDTYPELNSQFSKFLPFISDDLCTSQLEWISLVAQFDNPVDTIFFKPWWVPIQCNEYELFIDLSAPAFSLFRISYIFLEPYRWYQNFVFKDISEFLVSVDVPTVDLEKQKMLNKSEERLLVNLFFRERDELGYDGKLEILPIEIDDIVIDHQAFSCELKDNTLQLVNVHPITIGLLTCRETINLIEFEGSFKQMEIDFNRVKQINALVYCIKKMGMLKVKSFRIIFNNYPGSFAEYHDRQLTIVHPKLHLLNALKRKAEKIIEQD